MDKIMGGEREIVLRAAPQNGRYGTPQAVNGLDAFQQGGALGRSSSI